MSYCPKCGKELPEGGVCDCATAAPPPVMPQAAAPAAPAPEQPGTPPPPPFAPGAYAPPAAPGQPAAAPPPPPAPGAYAPQAVPPPPPPPNQAYAQPGAAPVQAAAPQASSDLAKSLGGSIKSILSSNALNGAVEAGKKSDPLWLLWLGASVLLYGLYQGIQWRGYSFGRGLVYGLVLMLADFMLLVGVVVVFAAISKKPVNFMGAGNTVGYAMLPVIAATVLCMVLQLIWDPLATTVSAAAWFACYLMVYHAVKEQNQMQKPPFWQYVAAYAAIRLGHAMVSTLLINLLMDSWTAALSGLSGLF